MVITLESGHTVRSVVCWLDQRQHVKLCALNTHIPTLEGEEIFSNEHIGVIVRVSMFQLFSLYCVFFNCSALINVGLCGF